MAAVIRSLLPRAPAALAFVALPLAGALAQTPPTAAVNTGVPLPLLSDPRDAATPVTAVRYEYAEPGRPPQRSSEVRVFSAKTGTLALRVAPEGGRARVFYARGDVVYEPLDGHCVAWYAEQATGQAALVSPRETGTPYAESGVLRLTEDSPPSAWLLSAPAALPAAPRPGGPSHVVVIDEVDEPEADPLDGPKMPTPPRNPDAPASRAIGRQAPVKPPAPAEELASVKGRVELWAVPNDRAVSRAEGTLTVNLPDEPARRFSLSFKASGHASVADLPAGLSAPPPEPPASCERPQVVASGKEVLPTLSGLRPSGQRGAERELRGKRTPEEVLTQAQQQLEARGYQTLGAMTGDTAPGLRYARGRRDADKDPLGSADPKAAVGDSAGGSAGSIGAVSLVWKRPDGGHVVAVRVRPDAGGNAIVTIVSARGNGQRVLRLR